MQQLHVLLSTKGPLCVHLFHCFYCNGTHKAGYSWHKKLIHQEPITIASNTQLKEGYFTERFSLLIFWQHLYHTSLCIPPVDTTYPTLQTSECLWGTCQHIIHMETQNHAITWVGEGDSTMVLGTMSHYSGNKNHHKERNYLTMGCFL